MNFKQIGIIHTCYPDKFGTPRQSGIVNESKGRIEIFSEYQPEFSLTGLEGFSHLWVLFYFHQNSNQRFHAKVHPPRLNGKTIGLFATRTPHRPNPIGLSLVKIMNIDKSYIDIEGLDIVDGTPVIDIKPYLPETESIESAKRGWTADSLKIEVGFSELAKRQLDEWTQKSGKLEIESLVVNTLKLDPRPKVYKGFEIGASPYRSEHAVRIYDADVHFKFVSEDQIEVFEIKL